MSECENEQASDKSDRSDKLQDIEFLIEDHSDNPGPGGELDKLDNSGQSNRDKNGDSIRCWIV